MPYIKSTKVYSCPSDSNPTASLAADGVTPLPRSYAAADSAEDLTLSQIDDPVETIVVTEKWGKDLAGGAIGETWFEVWDGDMKADPPGSERMWKYASRHQGTMNCAFFDGHARSLRPSTIWKSADLTGCALIHKYPSTAPSPSKCDGLSAGCITSDPTKNICVGFTYTN